MSFLGGMKTGRRFGAIALAVLVGGALACTSDREELTFQEGDYVFDFLVDQSLTSGIPAGTHSIANLQVVAIDPTRDPDAFGRTKSFYVDGISWVTGCKAAGEFDCTGWEFTILNGSQDTRLPALQDTDADYLAGVTTDSIFGDPWLLLVVLGGLDPSTSYTVTLERSALTINEGHDVVNVLFNDPAFGSVQTSPDAPDALAPVGGTPGNVLGSNPYTVGSFTTDATGATGLVIIPFTGTGNDDILETNQVQSFDLPQYNYVVIYETATGLPVGRAQLGVDLDATGEAVPNALAPFPTSPLTVTEALQLPGVAGGPLDVSISIDGLAELSGAVYQAWLFNEETGEIGSLPGTFVALDSVGDTVASATDVTTFNTQGDWTTTFTVSDPQVGNFTHIFLSVESSTATSPSAAQPVWSQFTDMAGDPTDPFGWSIISSGAVSFGTFGLGNPTEWAPNGRGEAGFWGRQLGTSDLLVVNYRNLQLPPVGYFYEAWLIHDDGTPVPAGQLVTTFDEGRQSLFDLDVDPSLSQFVSEAGLILRSETVTTLGDVQQALPGAQFYDFSEYRLTLSPKAGTGDMPPTTVLGGLVPEPVKLRKPAEQ